MLREVIMESKSTRSLLGQRMLEPPKLADEIIIAQLRANYDLKSPALEFLPLGNDARAWAFRVESASGACYLKLRKGEVNEAALLVPQFLRRRGLRNAVAPLPTTSGQLFARADAYALTLYPFIEGKSRWDMSLTPTQWRDWGAIMAAIHGAAIPPSLTSAIPRAAFALKWLEKLARVEGALARGRFQHAIAEEMALIWRQNLAQIELSRRRYLALGAQLKGRSPAFLLCHADIHPANIIIDGTGFIHIVDWDETTLAPKERDLMFFVEDGRPAWTTEAFLSGYGERSLDWLGLAYYKYDWVMQELADYGERVFLSRDLSDSELALALGEFARLFDAGDVVDRAHRAYANLQASQT